MASCAALALAHLLKRRLKTLSMDRVISASYFPAAKQLVDFILDMSSTPRTAVPPLNQSWQGEGTQQGKV